MEKTIEELQAERRERFKQRYKEVFGVEMKELTPEEVAEREKNKIIVLNYYGVKSNWL